MFAVIVPTKTASNLIPCLTALRKHEPTCPIVIVDDGLDQQGIDQAKFCQPINIVSGHKPFVYARNVNWGILAADVWFRGWDKKREPPTGYVILNDDALLTSPGGVSLLEQVCIEDPTIGCIGATTDLTGQPLQRRRFVDLKSPKFDDSVGLRFVEHIAFVCVYIPRRTLEIFSNQALLDPRFTYGLDERYTAYGSDDRDFCMQVEAAGLRVAVHDGCFVDHSSLQSTFRGLPTAAGDIWPNHRLLRAKWGMPPNPQDPDYRKQIEARLK